MVAVATATTRHVEASFGQLNASVRAGCVAVCVCLNLADQNFPLIVYALYTQKPFCTSS